MKKALTSQSIAGIRKNLKQHEVAQNIKNQFLNPTGHFAQAESLEKDFDLHSKNLRKSKAVGIGIFINGQPIEKGEGGWEQGERLDKSDEGWQPVPGSKHGGMRKRSPSGKWMYKYPSASHAREAANHHFAQHRDHIVALHNQDKSTIGRKKTKEN